MCINKGLWKIESDRREFSCPETGYRCLVVRADLMKCLSAYVACNISTMEDCKDSRFLPNVHGGITYTGKASFENRDRPALGFDGAHALDIIPFNATSPGGSLRPKSLANEETYRSMNFMSFECIKLAKQIESYEQM